MSNDLITIHSQDLTARTESESLPARTGSKELVVTKEDKRRKEIQAQLNAIVANEDSLAKRVYDESSDKENPISLPIIEFLQANGYEKLRAISLLPSLNEQGRYQDIAEIILSDAQVAQYFQGPTSKMAINWAKSIQQTVNEGGLIRYGLESLGVKADKDMSCLESVFQRSDIARFVQLASTDYKNMFSGLPTDGPDLPVRQLKYYQEWTETINQLGLSRLKQECRDLGVGDMVCDGAIPRPSVGLVAHLISEKYFIISKWIQSIDVYCRPNINGRYDLFAFVERTEPKGLSLIFKGNCDATKEIPSLLTFGNFEGAGPSGHYPATMEWQKNQLPWRRGVLTAYTITGGFLAAGLSAAYVASLSGAFANPIQFNIMCAAIGCALGMIGYSRFQVPKLNSDANLLNKLNPFPGLSYKGTENYKALYALEGKLE